MDNIITKNYGEWVNHIESLYNHQDLYEYGNLKYVFHPKWTENFEGFMKYPISIEPKSLNVVVSEIVVLDDLASVSNYHGNYLYMVTERGDGKIIMRYGRKGG